MPTPTTAQLRKRLDRVERTIHGSLSALSSALDDVQALQVILSQPPTNERPTRARKVAADNLSVDDLVDAVLARLNARI